MIDELDVLKTAQKAINQKLKELEDLEREKNKLLSISDKIDKKNILIYEKKLLESENKYIHLLKDVQDLSQIIKSMKADF